MALMAYLKLTGSKQGEIKGSVTQKGREGRIAVVASSHQITSPRDPQSGLPTGQRQHRPFVITKELDKSSPLLYRALVTNETITEWELQYWAPQSGARIGLGTEVQDYTVRLTNASISDIQFRQSNVLNPDLMRYPELEEIAFTYQKIEWIWVAGGVTTEDDWEARV